MKVVVKNKDKINHNVCTFYFKPPRKIAYTAGQFVELNLPHKNHDERGEKRWFTLSSSPTEELLSITTKYAGEKSSTFKRTLWALKSEATVTMSDPMGDFVLPKDKSIPLLFVAGGIGVTPFHSMIKWLLDTHEKRNIRLLLAANQQEDVIFTDLFGQYGVVPQIILTDPPKDWLGPTGRLTPQIILDLLDNYKKQSIYISGPEPMVETLTKGLEKLNVDKQKLLSDYFPGYDPI